MIRQAQQKDLRAIARLLEDINDIHAKKRSDIFKLGKRKYSDDELRTLINDDYNKIFVATNEIDECIGYIFTVIDQEEDLNSNFTNIKNLYIDDICVDSAYRCQGIGSQLLTHAKAYAREIECYRVILNVWTLNPQAIHFYEKNGYIPYKISMESKIDE